MIRAALSSKLEVLISQGKEQSAWKNSLEKAR